MAVGIGRPRSQRADRDEVGLDAARPAPGHDPVSDGPHARARPADPAATRRAEWAGSGAEVCAFAGAAELESAPGRWDVVALEGALEHERWDRWLVQRVHRVLTPGGVLVISVANLFDIWSIAGLRYLA